MMHSQTHPPSFGKFLPIFILICLIAGCSLEDITVQGDACSPSLEPGNSFRIGSIACYEDRMESACFNENTETCKASSDCPNCERDYNDCKRFQRDFQKLAANAQSAERLYVSAVNYDTNLTSWKDKFYDGKLNNCPQEGSRCAWTKDDEGNIAAFEYIDCKDDICGNSCVLLKSDNDNCGACGNKCEGGTTCISGQCVCTGRQAFCDGQCIDPLTNNAFCGAKGLCVGDDSGEKCSRSETCENGRCELLDLGNCDPGMHDEYGVCKPDTIHACGLAGYNCANLTGWKEGKCENRRCIATSCKFGHHLSNSECVPDSETCCGESCVPCVGDTPLCSNGTCKSRCEDDLITCPDDAGQKTCANTNESLLHCGNCNNPCAPKSEMHPHATEVKCDGGHCIATQCEDGYHRYDGNCEKDTAEHCGSHGASCATPGNGWIAGDCINKQCVATQCDSATHWLDENNVCAGNSNDHCGSAEGCVPGTFCSQGQCKSACNEPIETTCANTAANSKYCANLSVSMTDCGDCGAPCAPASIPNSLIVKCENGCKAERCENGYHVYNDACEPDDVDNCGSHGIACDALNAKNTCELNAKGKYACAKTCNDEHHADENGNCVRDTTESCGSGKINCKMLVGWSMGECTKGKCVAAQCNKEVAYNDNGTCVQNDNGNCGTKGNRCDGAYICRSGECSDNCGTQKLCPGTPDYCADISISNSDCGACGKKCEPSDYSHYATCESDVCKDTACKNNAHFNPSTHRCELDSPADCGTHGTSCYKDNAHYSCNNGQCSFYCKDGYYKAEADGTETCRPIPKEPNDCGVSHKNCLSDSCVDSAICNDAYACVPTKCKANCRKTASNTCEPNSNDCCGDSCIPCEGVLYCNEGTCTDSCGDKALCTPNDKKPYCADLNTDNSDCGACGHVCGNDVAYSAKEICESEKCIATACKDTHHLYGNICEEDSPDHCRQHNDKCADIPNGTRQCIDKTCTGACNNTAYPDRCLKNGKLAYCANIKSDDMENCGGCGVKCAPETVDNSIAAACKKGVCVATICNEFSSLTPEGKCKPDDVTDCGQEGRCPVPINGKATCKQGRCGISCNAGFSGKCGENTQNPSCRDFHYDYDNCGACGTSCGSVAVSNAKTKQCAKGACVAKECNDSSYMNNGTCIASTETACGSATNNCKTIPGWKSGDCEKNTCVATSCADGYILNGGSCKQCPSFTPTTCDNQCVDTKTDINYCGGCNMPPCTAPANGKAICEGGECGIACYAGYHVASDNKSCVQDTTTCCGTECKKCFIPINGKATCIGGECDFVCNAGYDKCSGACVDYNTNTLHCGKCNNKCTAPANATATCANKTCGFECKTGYNKCSGACVNTNTNMSHCGSCDTPCTAPANGTAFCFGGDCIISCNEGYILTGTKCLLNKIIDPINNCGSSWIDCNGDGSKCCKTRADCKGLGDPCLIQLLTAEPLLP